MCQVSRWSDFIPTFLALSHTEYFCQRKGREIHLETPDTVGRIVSKLTLNDGAQFWGRNSSDSTEFTTRRFLSRKWKYGCNYFTTWLLLKKHYVPWSWLVMWSSMYTTFGNISVPWEQTWPSHILCIQYSVVNMTELYSLCKFQIPKSNTFFYAFLH